MSRFINMLRCVLAAGAVGLFGCGQSSPPAVAVVPVAAEEAKADPVVKDRPEPKADNAPIPDGGSFPFPDDAGGKALAKSVTPPLPSPMPPSAPAVPNERKLPAYLDTPTPPLADAASSPPLLPMPDAKPIRPSPLTDRVPSDIDGACPLLPSRSELPTGPLTRQESIDIAKPADLPILSSRPVTDRAPLSDPTTEFTAQSVISSALPLRTEPTGFLRINLPDPFEHADAAKPRTPIVDDPNRSLGIPPPPRQ
jgi:hypothetical protein